MPAATHHTLALEKSIGVPSVVAAPRV